MASMIQVGYAETTRCVTSKHHEGDHHRHRQREKGSTSYGGETLAYESDDLPFRDQLGEPPTRDHQTRVATKGCISSNGHEDAVPEPA